MITFTDGSTKNRIITASSSFDAWNQALTDNTARIEVTNLDIDPDSDLLY